MATLNENTTGLNEILALVNALPEGLDTSDATALANTILAGYTAYVKGKKITGTIPSQEAQTITPGTTDQTIASGKYLSGTQTIKGDANLIAENIAKGVSIFDVVGALEAGGGGGLFITEIVPASDAYKDSGITVTHTLGKRPDFALLVHQASNGNALAKKAVVFGAMARRTDNTSRFLSASAYISYENNLDSMSAFGGGISQESSSSANWLNGLGPLIATTDTTVTIAGHGSNAGFFLAAGVSYRLFLGVYT